MIAFCPDARRTMNCSAGVRSWKERRDRALALQGNDKPFKKVRHGTATMSSTTRCHLTNWYHRLYDTHPPIVDRIAELEKVAAGQSV